MYHRHLYTKSQLQVLLVHWGKQVEQLPNTQLPTVLLFPGQPLNRVTITLSDQYNKKGEALYLVVWEYQMEA